MHENLFEIQDVCLDAAVHDVPYGFSAMSNKLAPDALTEPNLAAPDEPLTVIDLTAPRPSDPSSLPTEQSPPQVLDPMPVGTSQIGQTLLDRYVLLDELGAGGMGVVYRARDNESGNEVAVKMLPASSAGKTEAVERFRREATILASIQHPAVCPIIAFHDEGPVPFFTMKLIHGSTLRKFVDTDPPPSLAERYALLLQIARGLEAVHASGIVHRDLKPDNVLVASGQAVLIDFGLAKRFFTEGVTKTKVMGTPKYMAPEQLQGGPVGSWTDVYSFGVMAFELLSDTVRVSVNSEEGFDTTVSFASVELTPDVVRAMQSFFARALALAWKERFASATEMRAAFECVWAGLAIDRPSSKMPPPVGISVPPPQNVPRWMWVVLTCSVVVVLVVLINGLVRRTDAMPTLVRANKEWVACDPLKPTVEVAAFKNLSGETQWDSFASSLPALLRGHLRTSSKLLVTDETAEFGHCSTAWIVDGNVEKLGGKLRLSVEVHDATRAALVPPIEVDDAAGDTGKLVEKARDILLDDLRRQARFKERNVRAFFGTKNADARKKLFEYYRLAGTNPQPRTEDLEEGKKLVDEALVEDPDYVPALVQHAYLVAEGIGVSDRVAGVAAGIKMLNHALKIAPNDEEPLVMHCRLLRLFVEIEGTPTDRAIDEAFAACGRALRVAAESPYVRVAFARLYDRLCDHDRAIEALEQALLEDQSLAVSVLTQLIDLALHTGRLELADRASKQLIEVDESRRDRAPTSRGVHFLRGAVLMHLGEQRNQRYDEAMAEFARELERANSDIGEKWIEAGTIRGMLTLAKSRRKQVAPQITARLTTLENEAARSAATEPSVVLRLVSAYQWTAPDAAVEWLQRIRQPVSFETVVLRSVLLRLAGRKEEARHVLATRHPFQRWEQSCYVAISAGLAQ